MWGHSEKVGALSRNQCCWHFPLALPAFRTVRSKCCCHHAASSALLWQLELRQCANTNPDTQGTSQPYSQFRVSLHTWRLRDHGQGGIGNAGIRSPYYPFPPLSAGSKAKLCTHKYLAGVCQLIKSHGPAFPSTQPLCHSGSHFSLSFR